MSHCRSRRAAPHAACRVFASSPRPKLPGEVIMSTVAGAKAYQERYVVRAGHRIYVRDYAGAAPAFLMLHGFPDNCRIYEEVASRVSAAGRRVIAFDFLGFGAS